MKQASILLRAVSCSLVAVAMLQAPLARATMIGADAAQSQQAANQVDPDRAKVQEFLDRGSVQDKLRTMGVDALNARERVDALSDQEVHALAQRIDGLPAGGALSQTDLILILLVAILVLVAL